MFGLQLDEFHHSKTADTSLKRCFEDNLFFYKKPGTRFPSMRKRCTYSYPSNNRSNIGKQSVVVDDVKQSCLMYRKHILDLRNLQTLVTTTSCKTVTVVKRHQSICLRLQNRHLIWMSLRY